MNYDVSAQDYLSQHFGATLYSHDFNVKCGHKRTLLPLPHKALPLPTIMTVMWGDTNVKLLLLQKFNTKFITKVKISWIEKKVYHDVQLETKC